jgi:hypothetical protein
LQALNKITSSTETFFLAVETKAEGAETGVTEAIEIDETIGTIRIIQIIEAEARPGVPSEQKLFLCPAQQRIHGIKLIEVIIVIEVTNISNQSIQPIYIARIIKRKGKRSSAVAFLAYS